MIMMMSAAARALIVMRGDDARDHGHVHSRTPHHGRGDDARDRGHVRSRTLHHGRR